MIFFVYVTEDDNSIGRNLGAADYSYFFVMKLFLPVLKQFGKVVMIKNLARLDAKFDALQARNQPALLLAFTPPHKTPRGLRCPTLPVFAWEYSTIPSEAWANDPQQNWVEVLKEMAGAITHSRFAVTAVKQALGSDYPIASLPAPLWDKFTRLAATQPAPKLGGAWSFAVRGVVLDSQRYGLQNTHDVSTPSFAQRRHDMQLEGVIYTAVFNPNDGRKNWSDLLSAFCFAFRDNPSVTLIMKLAFYDTDIACNMVWREMKKNAPYQCRVIAIQGYLDADAYRTLVANTTYIVNSSYGEGQCLPLMEFMSAGKPAIAPDHTGMADYIDAGDAFVVRSNAEWTHWPHDPRLVLRAFRYRVDWESLRNAYLDSYTVATTDAAAYASMSEQALRVLGRHCSEQVSADGLAAFLQSRGFPMQRLPPSRPFLITCGALLRNFFGKWKR